MRDYLSLGSCAPEEDCVQVGTDNYAILAREQCRRYIQWLRAKVGPEPPETALQIKSFPHDFGTYLEVVCYFDTDNDAAVDYTYRCEAEAWD